jgi:hypothetical protein
VCGDLRRHEPLPDVFDGGEAQMFQWRDVTEEIGAGDGAPDGRNDMVVAGSDVRDERPEDVERGLVTDALLELDVP